MPSGGAVGDVPQDATAVWHRDEPFMLTFEANWREPAAAEAIIDWTREGLAAVGELPVAAGRYGNFPGLSEDPTEQIYGENYERLVDVKTAYDPENLFHVNQNMVPREEGER